MDSYINGKEVHIKNAIDLIGLGRKNIEFNIPKKDYWDMFKETMIVPTMRDGGVKNLLHGGWVYVSPWGNSPWDKDYFSKPNGRVWNDFSSQGDIFDYGTYTSGYYGLSNSASATSDADYAMYHQLNQLKPNTQYTWQFDIRRSSEYNKGNLETFFGTSSNTLIDRTKPYYINGVIYDGSAVDGYANWGERIDGKDTTWHRVVYCFTTKSTLPATGGRSLRWRVKKDGRWKMRNFMLYEGNSINGEDFRLHDEEKYNWMLFEGQQGLREVSSNFGFYYSEDYDFCSAFKVNIHNGVETLGYNPVTDEFEVRAEIECFAQIVNPVKKYYAMPQDVDFSKVNWSNSLMCNPNANGEDFLEVKAKGLYMTVFKVADYNWSPDVPRRWLTTFFESGTQWFYGGWFYTGNLQTLDIEN